MSATNDGSEFPEFVGRKAGIPKVQDERMWKCITIEGIFHRGCDDLLPAHQVENQPDPEAEEEIENLDQNGVFDRISQKGQYAMAVLDERRRKKD